MRKYVFSPWIWQQTFGAGSIPGRCWLIMARYQASAKCVYGLIPYQKVVDISPRDTRRIITAMIMLIACRDTRHETAEPPTAEWMLIIILLRNVINTLTIVIS